MLKLIFDSLRDLITGFLPSNNNTKEYKFAFLVHPRNIDDVFRKYPFARIFPKFIVEKLLYLYWPVVVSRVTGLKTVDDNGEIPGLIITIPLTAKQMIQHRKLALKKILRATKMAKNYGVKIIGLGGLTSSLSRGGIDIKEKITINVTTGHAYTAYNVTKNLFKLAGMFNVKKDTVKVAVVGAAGSVGSSSAELIARDGFDNLILVDLKRKFKNIEELSKKLFQINDKINLSISDDIFSVKEADFIITATNTPEAMIKNEHLKPGAVVIDDAQPSDVHPDVLKRADVLVIEAGVVYTPGVNSHFNFNLKDKHDNFCCMAEIMILASNKWQGDYVINRTNLELIDKVVDMSKHLEFRVGDFQNFLEKINPEKIEYIKKYYVS